LMLIVMIQKIEIVQTIINQDVKIPQIKVIAQKQVRVVN
jgi:hypothetical protein